LTTKCESLGYWIGRLLPNFDLALAVRAYSFERVSSRLERGDISAEVTVRQVRGAIAGLLIGLFGLSLQASPARAVTPALTTLSGHIVDAMGTGNVLSLNVWALSSQGGIYGGYTDANNDYTLQVPVGQYTIRVNMYSADSFQIDTALVTVSTATVMNITVPSRTRLVHALSNTGNPVAARITLSGGPTPIPVVPGQIPMTLTSWSSFADSTGAGVPIRTFNSPANSSVAVTGVPAWAKPIVLAAADPQDLTLGLPAVVNVSGLVVDKNGAPETGIKVALLGKASTVEGLLDQTGHYSFAAYSGSYDQITLRGDYIFTGVRSTTAPLGFYLVGGPVNIGGNTTLNLTVPAVPVSVHIRDADGLPVISNLYSGNRAVGVALPGVHPSVPFVLDEWLEEVGGTSDFSMHLFPGNATFRVSPTGLPELNSTFQVSAAGPNDITIRLPRPVLVSGTVRTTRSGELLEGVTVKLTNATTSGSADSDASGRYEMHVYPGTYDTVSLSRGASVPSMYSVTSGPIRITGATTLPLAMPLVPVALHFRFASGAPAHADFTLTRPLPPALAGSSGNLPAGTQWWWTTTTGPDVTVYGLAGPANLVIYPLGSTPLVSVNLSDIGPNEFTITLSDNPTDPPLITPTPSAFTPLVPGRLLDTRGAGTVDGHNDWNGLVRAGQTVELSVGSRSNVSADASAVVLNVTVTGAQQAGFVTVWPCGSAMPNASSLNFDVGETIPNAVIARVGTGGKVCLNSTGTTHLLADVTGFFPAGSEYEPLTPARLLDTRGPGTIDGQSQGLGLVPSGRTVELPVTSRGGVPDGVSAVVLNVTVTGAKSAGFVTVWPCGSPMPNASTVNFAAGATIPNAVFAMVGSGGKVCLNTSAATHLLADVDGYVPTGSSYQPLIPARLLDSRGGETIDGLGASPGIIAAGRTIEVVVGSRGQAPANASAAVLNVTVTGAQAAGFVTVWPCGSPMPNASSLNFGPGDTIANAVVTKLGTDGKVCLKSTAATHLLTDLNGIFPAST
jgi:hypothetical protein